MSVIVWFYKDLRLHDNPALSAATKAGKIIPIYILDEAGAGEFKIGLGSRWWLHHSLQSLSSQLDNGLQVYHGDSEKTLQKLIKKYEVSQVYWNNRYEPWVMQRDVKIKKNLTKLGIEVHTFHANLLWDPEVIVKKDGTAYKVFSAFFKKGCLSAQQSSEVLAKPSFKLAKISKMNNFNFLGLLDKNTQKHSFQKYWQPGELQAVKCLLKFIKHGLRDYKKGRDFPGLEVTSRLSPYLAFGEISPNKIWWDVQDKGYDFATRDNVQFFLKELVWREFAHNVLFYNPHMPEQNLHAKFDKFPWKHNASTLQAWQYGLTGYPIVDAGMRELLATGFMHNRVRMIVASFLIKNLLIDWRKGHAWFWELLVDADLASNSFNWQWVAGSGYDAAPYFRIFNPVLQAKKFDPKGDYVRKWVPELSKLPTKYIFEPYKVDVQYLQGFGVTLGKNYPKPIVDLSISRKQALANFKKL